MRRSLRILIPLLSVAFASSLSDLARAQTTEGFAVNRFEPSERGSEWFITDNLDFRAEGLGAAGLIVDWAHRPLVFRGDNGDETSLIADQVNAHLGASFVFWHRLRLATSLPTVMHQSGEAVTLDGVLYPAPQRTAVGDLRLSADVRILGNYRDPFTLAAGVRAWMPTGDRRGYAGDDAVRVGGQVLGAGEIGAFTYAARVGINYRQLDTQFADSSLGTEFVFAASAGVRLLDESLVIGPEIAGSTVVAGGRAFSTAATPVEILFGAHYTLEHWRFGAGVGPGLSRGFGAPETRGLLSAEYVIGAPPEPVVITKECASEDRDHDGVPDSADACPTESGASSEDPKKNGCPADSDADGVLDAEDACPKAAGVAASDPAKNGCPLPGDADSDGVSDDEDACPKAAGNASTDPTKNGCPVLDGDKDGIKDEDDACPKEAGAASSDPKKNGCPLAKIVGTKLEVLQTVEFELGSAKLTSGGKELLREVARVIGTLPETTHIAVHGHTDNKGQSAKNQKLSEERAKAVAEWLATDGGIAANRLSSKGFGDTKPIAGNDTEEGRKKNRRVEFNIEGQSAAKEGK